MKPYYEDKSATIYHGDVLEVLAEIAPSQADITFSSPPYNTIAATEPSGMMREHRHKQNAGYATYADDMPEPAYQEWLRNVFGTCQEKTKGLVWINHKTRYRDRVAIHPLEIFPWPFYSEVVWNRKGSITLNARKFAPSHEYIIGFGVPHYWDNAQNTLLSVWDILPERDIDWHPCPFPIEIAERCIVASCPEGGTVLDPFMGSGTTLRAAKNSNRKSIGIDFDERYCEGAANRLRQECLF